MIEAAHRAFTDARKVLLRTIFDGIIKPVADTNDLEIAWAMGSVLFTDKDGLHKEDTQTIQSLEASIQDLVDDVFPRSRCTRLWEVLSALHPAGSYHKSHGTIRDFDDRLRNNRKRK